MWNLFKKEKSKKLVAPVDGKLIPLSQVKDEAFASGALGTGYAVMFDGNGKALQQVRRINANKSVLLEEIGKAAAIR